MVRELGYSMLCFMCGTDSIADVRFVSLDMVHACVLQYAAVQYQCRTIHLLVSYP